MKWLKSAIRMPESANGALWGRGVGAVRVGRSGFVGMTFFLRP